MSERPNVTSSASAILHIEVDGEPISVGVTGQTHGNVELYEDTDFVFDADGADVLISVTKINENKPAEQI